MGAPWHLGLQGAPSPCPWAGAAARAWHGQRDPWGAPDRAQHPGFTLNYALLSLQSSQEDQGANEPCWRPEGGRACSGDPTRVKARTPTFQPPAVTRAFIGHRSPPNPSTHRPSHMCTNSTCVHTQSGKTRTRVTRAHPPIRTVPRAHQVQTRLCAYTQHTHHAWVCLMRRSVPSLLRSSVLSSYRVPQDSSDSGCHSLQGQAQGYPGDWTTAE